MVFLSWQMNLQHETDVEAGPILEIKGMCAIFQKKGQRNVAKGQSN